MNRKGIELASMTYIILGLVFLFTAVMFSDSIRGVIAPLIDSFGNFAGQSADDKIASSSVQALACAVDVTAYYTNNALPANGIRFEQFDSCIEKGELKAPKYVNDENEEPKDTYSQEFSNVAVSAQISNGKIEADDTSIKYIFDNSDIVPDKYTLLLKTSINQDMPVKDGSIALVSESPVLCADLSDLKFSGIVKVSFEAKEASGDTAKIEYTCSYENSVATEASPQITGGQLITVDGKKAVKFDTSIPDGTATTILYTDGEYIGDYKEDIMFGNKFSGNELSFNVAKIKDAEDYSKVTISFQNKNDGPADTAILEITHKNVNQQSPNGNDKSNDNALSGTKVSCGGVDYYLSATNVIDSADITINFNGGTAKTKTLVPMGSCSDKADNCFLDSSDYTKIKPYKGIEVNIKNIISNTVSTKVQCPADDISGMDASITGKLISSSSKYGMGFSHAVIDVTKSFGDKITGKAIGENKKCFGGSQDRCVVCETKDSRFSCTVTAFELPQKIRYKDGVFGSLADYGLAWTGFIGEPYYLAYYEKFPEEAAAAWTYDTLDIVWSGVALGAVMNIGGAGGYVKASWIGLKSGGEGMLVSLRSRELRSAFIEFRKGFKTDFNERIALEYGGKKALEHALSAEATSAIIGSQTLQDIGDNAIKNSIWIRMMNDQSSVGYKIFNGGDRPEALTAFHNLITGSKEVAETDIEKITIALEKDGADAELVGILRANKKKLTDELKDIQKKNTEGTLIVDSEKANLANNIKAFMDGSEMDDLVFNGKKFMLESKALKAYASKAAKDAYGPKGKLARLKNLVKSKSLSDKEEEIIRKNAEETAEMVYVNTLVKIDRLPGVDKSVKEEIIDKYIQSLDVGDLDRELVKEGLERSDKLWPRAQDVYNRLKDSGKIKGDLENLGKDKRTALMGFALGASYIGMSQNALEKYETTCGAGSLCLYTPSMLKIIVDESKDYGESNNVPFQLRENPSYNNLVMLQLPAKFKTTANMRFNLASPCKTDLKVSITKGNCVNYASNNQAVLEAKSGGYCGIGRYYARDATQCCKPSSFIDTNIRTDYFIVNKDDIDKKIKEIQDANENTDCGEKKIYSSIRRVNEVQNVKTGNLEYVSNCDQPILVDYRPGAKEKDYLIVEPDTNSMKKYSDGGFGENYCFENPTTWGKYAEQVGCPAGSIVASAAVIMASGGTLAPATIPTLTAAIGGGEAICGQLFGTGAFHDTFGVNGGPWPVSQY